MKKVPLILKIFLPLGMVATTLPIFAGYLVSFVLLIWLLFPGVRGKASITDEDRQALSKVAPALRAMHLGVAFWVLSFLVSALGAYALGDGSVGFPKVMSQFSHQLVKVGLLWWVLSTAFVTGWRRGFRLKAFAPWIIGWFALHALYTVVQRQTGIDWTHGLDAMLGPHRFAYGVYRISGFMGHPLTLAYNLGLLIIALWVACLFVPKSFGRRSTALMVLLAGVPLLLSGSRFPLVVALGVLACATVWQLKSRLFRYAPWLLLSVMVLAVILWLEGSLFSRTLELFDESSTITERFPRLTFWRVHWSMFLDHPVFGVGIAGRGPITEAYYTALGYRDKMYTAHNVYLQTLADTGLVGFLGLLGFFASWFVAARRLGRNPALIFLMLSGWVAGLLQNDFRDSEFLYTFWFLSAWLLAEAAGADGTGTQDPAKKAQSDAVQRKQTQDLEPAPGGADP